MMAKKIKHYGIEKRNDIVDNKQVCDKISFDHIKHNLCVDAGKYFDITLWNDHYKQCKQCENEYSLNVETDKKENKKTRACCTS